MPAARGSVYVGCFHGNVTPILETEALLSQPCAPVYGKQTGKCVLVQLTQLI